MSRRPRQPRPSVQREPPQTLECASCGKVTREARSHPTRLVQRRERGDVLLLGLHFTRAGPDTLGEDVGEDGHRVGRVATQAVKLLRHSDPAITLGTYGHLDVEDLRQAVDRLPFGAANAPVPGSDEPGSVQRFGAPVARLSRNAKSEGPGVSKIPSRSRAFRWSGRQDLNLRPLAPQVLGAAASRQGVCIPPDAGTTGPLRRAQRGSNGAGTESLKKLPERISGLASLCFHGLRVTFGSGWNWGVTIKFKVRAHPVFRQLVGNCPVAITYRDQGRLLSPQGSDRRSVNVEDRRTLAQLPEHVRQRPPRGRE